MLKILEVSKCHWTGSARSKVEDGVEILYSGMKGGPHFDGVKLILSLNTAKSLLEFRPVNVQLITARLQGKHRNITAVQCYAATDDFSGDEKDQFKYSLKIMVVWQNE